MDIKKLLANKEITHKRLSIVALIIRDNKVLMGLREYMKGKPVWTFPGGRCDEGETIKEALARELNEEIGITNFNIVRFAGEKLGAKSGDKVYFFECEIFQEPKLMEPEKFLQWEWFSLNDLPPNLIDQGDIKFIKNLLKS